MRNRCRDARGQALPLLLIVLAMTMLSVVVIARAGQAAADAAQARTAADAAALAGAADGRRAAERVAESNGGLMLDYAAQCHDLSDGRFDITSGVLRRAWRFDGSSHLPEQEETDALLDLVGWCMKINPLERPQNTCG